MSVTTARELSEIELLHFYLGMRITSGDKGLTIDEALQDYAEYRRQLDDLRAKLREAEKSSARGLATPLDVDALKERVRRRLKECGVTHR